MRQDQCSISANCTVDSFFQRFIDLMAAGDETAARSLFDFVISDGNGLV